jgi:acyl-CoA synthetase (AMP-forming)/AMP-acid ligase II
MSDEIRHTSATSMMDNEKRVLLASINAISSIPSLLDRRALERPDAIALACASATTGWTRVSWARFAEDTRRVAAGLHELGVKGGDHVAVLLGTRTPTIALSPAAGCCVVAVFWCPSTPEAPWRNLPMPSKPPIVGG